MRYRVYTEEAHDLGPKSFFVKDLFFQEVLKDGELFLKPSPRDGEGIVYQFSPASGFFLSTGDWKPYAPMGRQYQIDRMFIELYFIESGDITLVRNGKKAFRIPRGVNVYLNRPSKGRLLYGAGTPIKYVSVALFDDFISEYAGRNFSEEDFDFSETFCWKAHNYNTPEVTLLFLQLRRKLLAFEKSRMYYESKTGELLSIIMSNFRREKERWSAAKIVVPPNDLAALERVRAVIDQNVVSPPDIYRLCRIAAMGRTKLRESFKAVYDVTLGGYIREAKMKHALMLLANKDLPVRNAAAHLGYASASKFSIAFKMLYGMSPEEYRRTLGL